MRHSKPWGCTFSGCYGSYGSKGDWIRHELSKHFHFEMWKCGLNVESGGRCHKSYFNRDEFRCHLKRDHNIQDRVALRKQMKVSRIGRNCQGQTWCGFCHTIIVLQESGRHAWDYRFNHIDQHFKKGCLIQDYIPADLEKAKGPRLEECSDVTENPSSTSNETSPSESTVPDQVGIGEGERFQIDLRAKDRESHEAFSGVSEHKRKRPRSKSPSTSAPESKKSRRLVRYCVSQLSTSFFEALTDWRFGYSATATMALLSLN
jgi:hypothetical protein